VKLSVNQAFAMDLLENGPVNEAWAILNLGATRRRTMRSLERIGFCRWYPTPEHWKLTPDGKAWLADENARVALREHQAKTDAAIAAYRSAP
jgi:hypothetical protein